MIDNQTAILLQRLRSMCACAPGCEGRCDWCPDRIAQEAADIIEQLRVWLQNIVDVHAARSELFTSEAECAASLADRAQAALDGRQYR